MLSKWKCRAPLLTPARRLIAVSEADTNPSSAKTSAAARINDRRVRAARSCLTINISKVSGGPAATRTLRHDINKPPGRFVYGIHNSAS